MFTVEQILKILKQGGSVLIVPSPEAFFKYDEDEGLIYVFNRRSGEYYKFDKDETRILMALAEAEGDLKAAIEKLKSADTRIDEKRVVEFIVNLSKLGLIDIVADEG